MTLLLNPLSRAAPCGRMGCQPILIWPAMIMIERCSGISRKANTCRWLRNAGIPSYGVSGLFVDPVTDGVHGLNEQVGVKELYDSKVYLYRLIKRLAAPSQFSQR